MMKRAMALLALAALAACTPQGDPLEPGQKRDDQSGVAYSNQVLLTMDDGCVVSLLKIRNNGEMKMVKCPATVVSAQWSSGKTTYQSLSIPVEETDAQRKVREDLWRAQARKAALEKLTPQERVLLEIPK